MRTSTAIVCFVLSCSLCAEDWVAWRGEHRSALAPSLPAPVTASAPHKVWEVRIGGGYSSPVLTRDCVVAHRRDGDAATWTQPIPTVAGLLIRSVSMLARWDWAPEPR